PQMAMTSHQSTLSYVRVESYSVADDGVVTGRNAKHALDVDARIHTGDDGHAFGGPAVLARGGVRPGVDPTARNHLVDHAHDPHRTARCSAIRQHLTQRSVASCPQAQLQSP